MQYTLAAGTPHASEHEHEDEYFPPQKSAAHVDREPPLTMTTITDPSPEYSTVPPSTVTPPTRNHTRKLSGSHQPQPLQTRLAMSSMISYFNDRILTPEMMRAMIILYIGPHNRPDFSQDYLLSPILAPDSLLAHFPKTYFLTGERDPLVDDTVIFAGRLRRAKAARHLAEQSRNVHLRREFDERDVVEVYLIPGISHGFLQFVGVFPEGWKYIFRCARWIEHIFADADAEAAQDFNSALLTPREYRSGSEKHHHRRRTESSGDEDTGLEMSMGSRRGKEKEKEAEQKERRRKERLLREEMDKRRKHSALAERKKSLVSLASSDDLLGRRMLGLAGPLTGRGDGGDKDE